MKESTIYNGKTCAYWQVKEANDERLLCVCEKAAEVILSHDWHDMNYGKLGIEYLPRADFELKETSFIDCKVCIINDYGSILAYLVGKSSKKRSGNDFIIDLHGHPKIGDKELSKYFQHGEP